MRRAPPPDPALPTVSGAGLAVLIFSPLFTPFFAGEPFNKSLMCVSLILIVFVVTMGVSMGTGGFLQTLCRQGMAAILILGEVGTARDLLAREAVVQRQYPLTLCIEAFSHPTHDALLPRR